MAKNLNSKTPGAPAFKGYVRWYLNDELKTAVKANTPNHKDLLNRVARYVEDEYKVSFGWDYVGNCFQVQLFDMNVRRPSAGWVLSARHSDLLVAFALLTHLHEKVFADGWDVENTSVQDLVNW